MKWAKGQNSRLGSPKNQPIHLPPGRGFPVLPINCYSQQFPYLVKALHRMNGEPLKGLMAVKKTRLSGFYFGGPKHIFERLGAGTLDTNFGIHSQNHWTIFWRGRASDQLKQDSPHLQSLISVAFERKIRSQLRRLRVESIGMTKDFGLLLLLSGGWRIEICGIQKCHGEAWRLMLPDDEDQGLHWVLEARRPWNRAMEETDKRYGPAQDWPVTHIRPQRRPNARFIGHMKPGP